MCNPISSSKVVKNIERLFIVHCTVYVWCTVDMILYTCERCLFFRYSSGTLCNPHTYIYQPLRGKLSRNLTAFKKSHQTTL